MLSLLYDDRGDGDEDYNIIKNCCVMRGVLSSHINIYYFNNILLPTTAISPNHICWCGE